MKKGSQSQWDGEGGGRWERVSGSGTFVHPWLILVEVWQKPRQNCKVISLQLKLINYFKKRNHLLELIIRPHPRNAGSGPSNLCFNKPSGWFWWAWVWEPLPQILSSWGWLKSVPCRILYPSWWREGKREKDLEKLCQFFSDLDQQVAQSPRVRMLHGHAHP